MFVQLSGVDVTIDDHWSISCFASDNIMAELSPL
jgi:hypothetical protein